MGRAGALEGADLEDEFLGGHRDPWMIRIS